MSHRIPPRLSVFGVRVVDMTFDDALEAMLQLMSTRREKSVAARLGAPLTSGPKGATSDGVAGACTVYFVSAHTLNLAHTDREFRDVLNRADFVFGDGTGVRWACRVLHGADLKDNVNGTDLVPSIFRAGKARGLSYYLLGNTKAHVERAASYARETFEGWTLAGYHHGYIDDTASRRVVEAINASGAHMLLVGMGNPLQEKWLDRHSASLTVPVCLGIGGLLDYWAGNIERAPSWLRRLGHEWAYILWQQPKKASRYLLGNPLFLARMMRNKISGVDRQPLPAERAAAGHRGQRHG